MSWSAEVHDAPTYAPATYASLPPVVRITPPNAMRPAWHGSGFGVADVDRECASLLDEMRACAKCGSVATRFIYVHYFHHMVESDVVAEVLCPSCGAFTVHRFERL